MLMMLFIFLCFSGLFVMFFFLLRGQEAMHTGLKEELAQTRAQLRTLEIRVAALGGEEAPGYPGPLGQSGSSAQPGSLDNLDSLSMEVDKTPTPDKALELKF